MKAHPLTPTALPSEVFTEAHGRPGEALLKPEVRLLERTVRHKAPQADLRRAYYLTIEVGLLLALGVLVVLFHVPMQAGNSFEVTTVAQEVVQMEEIKQTKQIEQPPPPPRPQVPIAVADEMMLEDEELDLDASLDINEPMNLPIPPPPAPVEEAVEEEDEPEVFIVVEEMPELIGGLPWLQKQLKYPAVAEKAGVQGRVIVQFVVSEEGQVLDPVVLRGIGGGCDEEALRAVMLARFKPGMQRGKPVRVRYVLPVVFMLR